MLIDYDVLKKLGTTSDAIKELFTADYTTEKGKLRKKWEDRIESRIHEGALWGLKNYQFYQAADLAWDSNLITKEMIPLALYAQGKIKVEALSEQLKQLSPETKAKFIKEDEKTGKPVGVDIPAFHKVVINLVRALITKRVASLSTRYTKQYPFYEYEPLGTSFVAKLRGDALSQRIEMMTNQYDYRHDLTQQIRDMLLYSFSVEFPRSAWDRERQIRKAVKPGSLKNPDPSVFDIEAFVSREGLAYKRPHPSRIFYDMSFPLASVNTDTGVRYIGHWNILPYRDVQENPAYFNVSNVQFDASFASKLVGYRNYWALYFPDSAINFPTVGGSSLADIAGMNEREKQTGLYSSEEPDRTIMLTEYFERVIPRDVGIGEYPYPVWVRLVVASDRTVVYGEIMPCTPATYMGYNCADGKILNNAYAHEAIPFQDQMSNMLTNLLFAQRSALIKVLALDIDLIQDPDILKQIREIVRGESIYTKPLLVEYKGVNAASMGLNHHDVIKATETAALSDPTLYFKSILQVLNLAERMLGTSANESAQSEPREVSATESTTIAGAVNTNIAFMGQGVDEAIQAKKRQLYEAFMACGESRVRIPVVNRYSRHTIKAAGFEPEKESDETQPPAENYLGDEDPRQYTITGEKQALVYDYNFSSRDGSERAANPKSAEVLMQLIQPLSQMPGVIQGLGKQQLYDLLNAIVRMSGAGVDVQFEVQDGEDDAVPTGDPVSDNQQAVQQAIEQLLTAVEQDRAKIAQIQQALGMSPGGGSPAPAPAPGPGSAMSAPPPGGPAMM